MARFDIPDPDHGHFASAGTELYRQLGMRHSAGRAGTVDLVEAHKWFNIAAAQGDREAAMLRSEVAAEMSAVDIAAAQRAARAFLALH